jgi:enoyl-[acyl-carrier protein] reductase II
MKTRVTELLGIKHPVIQCGMADVAGVEMVAAVCNAGGLGFLPMGNIPVDEYRNQIRRIKELVGNKPFGCNISPLVPGMERYVKVWIEEKVPVWGSAIRDPFSVLGIKKPTNVIYIPTIGKVSHGKKLEDKGLADAVITHGVEGGGHPGKLSSSVLVPKAAETLKIPVIAAGGFSDGRGLAAALAMGAEAVGMGTRFATSKESRIPIQGRNMYLATEEDVPVNSNRFDGVYCNVIEGDQIKPYRGWWTHPWSVPIELVRAKLSTKARWPELIGLALYMRKLKMNPVQWLVGMPIFEKGLIEGDIHRGLFWSGQVVGRIHDILSCEEIINQTVHEAEEIINSMYQRFGANPA